MTLYVGIDPGLSGAVAVVNDDGRLIDVTDTPTFKQHGKGNKRDFLVAEMRRLLAGHGIKPERMRVALEAQQAMPKQGVSSTFKTGRGFGLWEGLLAGVQIPYEVVRPTEWKRAIGIKAGSPKDASRALAQQLVPESAEHTNLKKHDGRAEAILLAEWLRLKWSHELQQRTG